VFAAHDADGASRRAKERGEKLDQGVVCGALDRRRGEADDDDFVADTPERGLPRTWDDADVELDARGSLANHVTGIGDPAPTARDRARTADDDARLLNR
jgi:hypothetical protein